MYLSWATNKTLIMAMYIEQQDSKDFIIMKKSLEILNRVGKGLFDVVIIDMPDRGQKDLTKTFANMVHLNNKIAVPVYTDGSWAPQLEIISNITGKTVVPIFSDAIVKYNGVLHCITKTMP